LAERGAFSIQLVMHLVESREVHAWVRMRKALFPAGNF
jgi:hypothetical protein